MHFPYVLLFVKNQCFEKLTKGTALGGLPPQNSLIMSPFLKDLTLKFPNFLGK